MVVPGSALHITLSTRDQDRPAPHQDQPSPCLPGLDCFLWSGRLRRCSSPCPHKTIIKEFITVSNITVEQARQNREAAKLAGEKTFQGRPPKHRVEHRPRHLVGVLVCAGVWAMCGGA